jgi:hypothetical protein
VGVAAQIVEYLLRPGKRRFGIDDPLLCLQAGDLELYGIQG